MDSAGEGEAEFVELRAELAADVVVIDGDDGVGYAACSQDGQLVHSAEDWEAFDLSAVEVGVVVEEADGVVTGGLAGDVEGDATVPAGAEKDEGLGGGGGCSVGPG